MVSTEEEIMNLNNSLVLFFILMFSFAAVADTTNGSVTPGEDVPETSESDTEVPEPEEIALDLLDVSSGIGYLDKSFPGRKRVLITTEKSEPVPASDATALLDEDDSEVPEESETTEEAPVASVKVNISVRRGSGSRAETKFYTTSVKADAELPVELKLNRADRRHRPIGEPTEDALIINKGDKEGIEGTLFNEVLDASPHELDL